METWKRCKREETGKNRGSKGEGGEERDRGREGASPPLYVLVKRVNQLLLKSLFGLDFLPIVRESSLDTSFRFEFLGFFCFCFFNDKGQYNFMTGNMCTSVCKYN